jgi:hypothetical protein
MHVLCGKWSTWLKLILRPAGLAENLDGNKVLDTLWKFGKGRKTEVERYARQFWHGGDGIIKSDEDAFSGFIGSV